MQKINLKHSRSAFLSVLIGTSVLPYVKAGSSDLEHGKLDAFHLLVASKYFKNSTDFMNASMVSKKYATTIDKLLYNPIEVTPDTVKNFSHLQTLHIYDVRNLVDHDGNRTLTLDELEKIIKERYAEVDNRIHKYVIWTNDLHLLSKKEYHNLEFKDNKGHIHYYIDKSKENSDIKIDIRSLYEKSIRTGRYDCPIKELFIEGDVESINMLEVWSEYTELEAIHIAPGIKHIGNLEIRNSTRKIDIEGENVQIDSTNGNILPRGKDLSIGAVNIGFKTGLFGEENTVNVGSVKKDELVIKENISNKEKNEALFFACENGQLNAVKYLVEHGADVNAKDRDGRTPLICAARSGNLELVKYLVEEKGADVNAAGGWHNDTPLGNAAKNGHWDIVKYLVDHGADANNGRALGNAAFSGNLELVKYLVEEKGADVNARDNIGTTPLSLAAREGHWDIVKYLVDHGADVNAGNGQALRNAAFSGNLELVKYLVEEKGADVNAADNDGNTPLIWAAENGQLNTVKYLVEEKGADVNARGEEEDSEDGNEGFEDTALMKAASNGHTEIVKLLIANGAFVNAVHAYDGTALMKAAESGHIEIAKLLIDNGADVSYRCNIYKDSNHDTALMKAAGSGHIEMVKLLIANGADINDNDDDEYENHTALIRAVENNEMEVVKYLVECGADVNATDEEGNTPLSRAVSSGNLELVKYLVEEKGADVNADNGEALSEAARSGILELVKYLVEEKGADVNDGLWSAASSGNLELVKYLVEEKGADVNADNGEALSEAARSGNLEIVKYLVEEKGADVNAGNGRALRSAARSGNLELVKYLVEHGADVNAKDRDGRTPLICAARSGNLEIVKYLVEHGADVNVAGKYGDTPLSSAASSGNLDIVKYLVEEKGADVNAKSGWNNETPLMGAASNGHLDIVKYLVEEKGADVNAGNGGALKNAASRGHWDIVKYLKEHGAIENSFSGGFGSNTGFGGFSFNPFNK